jgi:hypothetical protein
MCVEDNNEFAEECCGERVIKWLKIQGIVAGDPE